MRLSKLLAEGIFVVTVETPTFGDSDSTQRLAAVLDDFAIPATWCTADPVGTAQSVEGNRSHEVALLITTDWSDEAIARPRFARGLARSGYFFRGRTAIQHPAPGPAAQARNYRRARSARLPGGEVAAYRPAELAIRSLETADRSQAAAKDRVAGLSKRSGKARSAADIAVRRSVSLGDRLGGRRFARAARASNVAGNPQARCSPSRARRPEGHYLVPALDTALSNAAFATDSVDPAKGGMSSRSLDPDVGFGM